MPSVGPFTGFTTYGLYSDATGDALFGSLGATAPASALYVAGMDYGTGFLQAISVDSTGKVNVNASITPPSDNTQTGALAAPADTVTVSTEGTSALMVQILLSAAITAGSIQFQVSLDGTTWQSVNLYPAIPNGTPAASSTTVAGNWTLPVGGIQKFRVVASAGFAGGPANIVLTAGQGQYGVFNYSDNAANFLATVNQGTSPWVTSVSGDVNVTNSGTFAVQVTNTATVTISGTVAVTQSTSPWVVSGTVTANAGTGTFTVAGNLTHNAAAPTADNIGALVALANAAAPTYTEGDQVLLSTDLAGNLRTTSTISGTVVVVGNKTNNNAAPSTDNLGVLPAIAASGTFDAPTPQAYTAGDLVLPVVSKGGSAAVIPVDELYANELSYYSVDNANAYAPNLVNSTITPLVSIRSSSAAFKFLIRSLSTFTDGSQCLFRLYKNPTLTGATFGATPPTGSHVTFDTAATAVTAGQVVWSTYSANNMRPLDALTYYLAAGAPGDVYTLAAEKFGSGTAKAAGAMQWSEQAAAL